MTRLAHILVVDDDREIRSLVSRFLTEHGFKTSDAADARKAVQVLKSTKVDLVILDLMLPGEDGLSLCRRLRAEGGVPIIMLTALASDVDRIVGLELGADDYVTKPFSFRELVARIRAVARRSAAEGGAAPVDEAVAGPQAIGGLKIDRRTRRVFVDEQEVQLTAKEFDLLAFLAGDIGAVRTRTEILENVWDAHWYGPTKTVDAHVASLRKKLGGHEWIQAVRGVGFRLEPPE